MWHVNLTVVPTGLGFWLPWFPFSLPVRFPFCFWVAGVLDHFSRVVVAKRAYLKEPRAEEICRLLDAAVRHAGAAPAHVVSDHGAQFGEAYRAWCRKHDVKPRFGKIGEHGSIALIERFWRSMKSECFRRLPLVPLSLVAFERELDAYVVWYNEHRPHQGLTGRTPVDVCDGLVPACERTALEARAGYPLARAGPGERQARRLRGRLVVSIASFRRRAHLPLIELRDAA